MTGAELISQERERQKRVELYTEEQDDRYVASELARAAISYLRYDSPMDDIADAEKLWPWSCDMFKPQGHVRNLMKAGALIAAEIDRVLRIQQQIESA